MDLIQALTEKLERLPKLIPAEMPGGIRFAAPDANGFAVEVLEGDSEWTVFLGEVGFHEHFETGEEALNFVIWCYSGDACIRETWRGDSPSSAVLEAREDDACSAVSRTQMIFVPFWRARREIVRRNPNLLKSA